MQAYSKNHIDFVAAPDYMRSNGYPDPATTIMASSLFSARPLTRHSRIPLETSTSLDVSPLFLAAGGTAMGCLGR
jgi:hypothetical protein